MKISRRKPAVNDLVFKLGIMFPLLREAVEVISGYRSTCKCPQDAPCARCIRGQNICVVARKEYDL
jgi:hypothetical protein